MRLILLALSLAAMLAPGAAAQTDWTPFKREGAVVLMRHALAPGTGDPANFTLGDCSTQRNLDDRGRAQARRIGAALREAGVTFDAIWASEWCRTRETAELLDLGPVTPVPALNSFFGDYAAREPRTEAARARLAELPEGHRVLLVTHQVNISALTGRGTRSGEMVAATRGPEGSLTVTGQVLIPAP